MKDKGVAAPTELEYYETVPRKTRIVEIEANGIDEGMQTFSSDPYRGSGYVGLRVPTLATTDNDKRYLFLLATFSIPEKARARIIGYRQLLTIGINRNTDQGQTPYIFEQQVTTPFWHFSDANVSWHLHRLGPPQNSGFPLPNPFAADPAVSGPDIQSMKFGFAQSSALLYQTYLSPTAFYTQLTSYTPPNRGRPWGTPLTSGHQGTFHDLRIESTTHGAWHSLDLYVEGPETVAFFASVRQTDPAERSRPSSLPTNFFNLELPEEKFVQAFTTVPEEGPATGPIIWRVGGSLVVEYM